jgi:FMN-dependent NADH-azoreductase
MRRRNWCLYAINFTFRYTPTGVQGLLKNKKCLHIHSSGGFHSKDPQSHADGYLKDIMSFFGVQDYKCIVVEGHQADKLQ